MFHLQIFHPELLPRHSRPHLCLSAGQGAAQQRAIRDEPRDGRVHRDRDPRDHQVHGQLRRGCGDYKISSRTDVQVSIVGNEKLQGITAEYLRSEQQKLGLEIGGKRSTNLGQNIYAGRSSGWDLELYSLKVYYILLFIYRDLYGQCQKPSRGTKYLKV